MTVVRADDASIARAGALIAQGGVVAFPTETVYGLGANALDATAVARIFEIKRRPRFDPLIVHVTDRQMLARVTSSIPSDALRLIERFWPGPLTLVVPKSAGVPEIVTSGLPTVAVRMPSHEIARAIIRSAAVPVAAPSANPFGAVSPTRAEHVERMLGDTVDLIVDAGPATHGIESTIVAFTPEPVLLRHGAVPVEAIEEVTGPVRRATHAADAPLAPGQLASHYAPRTPLRIVDPREVPMEERRGAALLAFAHDVPGYAARCILSQRGDLREAATRLFAAIHELDTLGAVRIDAEPVPQTGLGSAIMDRLQRAAVRREVGSTSSHEKGG